MWSLGVILYILLCGGPPFNPTNMDKPLIKQITEGDYSFPKKEWSKISQEAVDLVKKLVRGFFHSFITVISVSSH